jgi:hypothetical protein
MDLSVEKVRFFGILQTLCKHIAIDMCIIEGFKVR